MPYALFWHRENPTSIADQPRHYMLDPPRNHTGDYESPQHHPPEPPSFRPLSSIAATVARVPDPSNRYSMGRRSFPQTFNYHDREDDYFPDQISRRGYGPPSSSPGPPVCDYRRPQQIHIPTRPRTPRPRPGSPVLKRSDSGLSNLSRTSTPLASAFGEPPGGPRSSSPHPSPPSNAPQRDAKRLNHLIHQIALAKLYKTNLRRSSMGRGSQRDEVKHVEELPPDQELDMTELDMEALPLAILREILAYPVNPPSGGTTEVVDSGKDHPSTPRSPIIALMASYEGHSETQEQRQSQKEEQEQSVKPRGLPSMANASSENLATTPVPEEAEQAHRGSVSSISSSVVSNTSNNSGGTVWKTSMSSMSSVVLYASAGILGYHTPFLIQRGILYLREFTMLHGSILRVFYMYESILCSPLVARSGLLFK